MKTEWKVIVSLVVLLILLEVGVRVFETELSKDLKHLRSLPASAKKLKKFDGYKILIVGNSLARHGINKIALAEGLKKRGYDPVQIESFYPDSTSITEWNFGLKRYYLNQDSVPDRIILVTGRAHLLDSQPSPERLGAFYVDTPDLKEAVTWDIKSVEDRSRFILARLSSLYANRERIEPFILYNFLPRYTETIRLVYAQRSADNNQIKKRKEKTGNLDRLLKAVQAKGVAVSVVAMPMRNEYQLPEAVELEVNRNNVEIWNLSAVSGIGRNNFFDDYHLDFDGANILTAELIRNLPIQNTKHGN